MKPLFQCPECHRFHAEPPSAAYLLAVRCADCELLVELDESRRVRDGLLLAA